MKNKLTKLVMIGVTSMYLAGGCTEIFKEKELEKPKREDFSCVYGGVLNEFKSHINQMYIMDKDCDGEADSLFYGSPYFVAPGHEDKFHRSEYARPLTGELREAATKAMKADQELYFLIAQDRYQVQEEKKDRVLDVYEKKHTSKKDNQLERNYLRN